MSAKDVAGLNRVLERLMERMEPDCIDAATFALEPVLQTARVLVPVDKGTLRDSLELQEIRTSRGVGAIIGSTMGLEGHADDIEFGDQDNLAQPFMRPAEAQNRQQVFRRFGQRLGENIEKGVR